MKLKLKYLGIGLFVAGLLFSLSTRFSFPFVSSETNDGKSDEALQKELTAAKKEIAELQATIEKFENNTANETTNTETVSESSQEVESATPQENSDVVEATIYIYEDLSLYDIGKQAEDLQLVKNGRELELFLSKREYARSVQKGQFDLNSSMTIEEIANIITGKTQN